MTKKDLKDEMIVVTRCGIPYLVCGDKIVNLDGYMPLSSYNDKLECTTSSTSAYDIVFVYDIGDYFGCGLRNILTKDSKYLKKYGKLVYPITVEMTVEQIEAALGKKIKIVSEEK